MLLFIRSVVVFVAFGLTLLSYGLRADPSDSIMTARQDSEEYFDRELSFSVNQIGSSLERAFSMRESDWKGAVQESAQLFLLLDQSLVLLKRGLSGDHRAFSISSKIPEWERLLIQLQVAVERDLAGKFERRLEESEEFMVRKTAAQEMLTRFREIILFAFVSAYAVDWPRDLYLSYQTQFHEKTSNSLVKIQSYIEGTQFMCRILFLDLAKGLPQ